MIKNIRHKKIAIYALLFLTSLLISTLFYFGKVDQDYFSYYYVGRKVLSGSDMFVDVLDNKGPFLYLLFAFLNLVFKDNYMEALVVSSAIVDFLVVVFGMKLTQIWICTNKEDFIKHNWIVLFFLLLIFKSFSIGVSMGGLYSEAIALLLVIFSLFLFEKNRNFMSGVLFALAVLTRQTVLFFGLMFVGELFFSSKREVLKKLIPTSTGFLVVILSLLIVLARLGNLSAFYQNYIILNLRYASTVADIRNIGIIAVLFYETRLLFILLFIVFVAIHRIIYKGVKDRLTIILLLLLLSSTLSTFVGGLTYFHHFSQLGLLFFYVLLFRGRSKGVEVTRYVLILMVGFFTLLSYLLFVTPSGAQAEKIEGFVLNQTSKLNPRYIQAIPYYPKFYIITGKDSPNRYYNSGFLSEYRNRGGKYQEISNYKMTDKARIADTMFVFVWGNGEELLRTKEFKKDLGDFVRLQFVDSLSLDGVGVEIYISAL